MVTLSPVGLAAAPVANQAAFLATYLRRNCVVAFVQHLPINRLQLFLIGMKHLFLTELRYSCLL